MDTPPEPQRIFRCPRCRHADFDTVPGRTQCPQCGLTIPRPEPESIPPSLALQLVPWA